MTLALFLHNYKLDYDKIDKSLWTFESALICIDKYFEWKKDSQKTWKIERDLALWLN